MARLVAVAHSAFWLAPLGVAAALAFPRACPAQVSAGHAAPTAPPHGASIPEAPGSGASLLGPAPGSGGVPDIFSQREPGPLSGRAGPSVPRVPANIGRPGGDAPQPEAAIRLPSPLPAAAPGVYGPLVIPEGPESEGPPDGLTLDQAIDLLLRQSVDLQAVQLEIPKAQADVLTASLRTNPILFADSQLIPYQRYSEERPGGPTQYDINITFPLDVTGKRRARIDSACRARRVVEAQFQDAVRLQIDNVYTAFVDALAARETVRFAEASVDGLQKILDVTAQLREKGLVTQADVERVAVQLDAATLALEDSTELEREARRALALLLHIEPEDAEQIQVRGALRMPLPELPPRETLVQEAIRARPDLAAFRLGVDRAAADLRLAEANRFENPFLLVQPYTFQDNAPFDRRSAHSWAVGVTVPLPVYNRNQGNIQRARLTVGQTQLQVEELERRIQSEVQREERLLAVTGSAIRRLEQSSLPRAEQTLRTSRERLAAGEEDLIAYLGALRDYNEIVRQYRDTLVRHRRAMLRLNTVLGMRLLP
jgi:cobalt-zinc-cadmium efflux system outer membrane protein